MANRYERAAKAGQVLALSGPVGPSGSSNSSLSDKALDFYKDLILAFISTSGLLITISLTLVTSSTSVTVLGEILKSKTAIGYSSFFFLMAIVFSTFAYQRMVGLLHDGIDFYDNHLFRGFMIVGWASYVIGASLMFLSIYSLAFGA